jgi:hypothetical protein
VYAISTGAMAKVLPTGSGRHSAFLTSFLLFSESGSRPALFVKFLIVIWSPGGTRLSSWSFPFMRHRMAPKIEALQSGNRSLRWLRAEESSRSPEL